MKTKILLLALASLFIFGCDKDKDVDINGKVDIYLLESHSVNENTNFRFQIIDSTIITEKHPFVSYSEILSYNPEKHELELSAKATKRIKDMKHSVWGVPFAVKVNNSLIYSGYFWPGFSSASCDWITIDPVMTFTENTFEIRLGYPGLLDGVTIPDKRNDDRLIEIFKRDNKLK